MAGPVPIVLLSGGLDSAVVACLCARHHHDARAIHFDYGQPAAAAELAAARRLAAHLAIPFERVALPPIARLPSGEFRGRNAILVLHAAARVAPAPAVIAAGIHAGAPYYDATPRFAREIQAVLDGYSGGAVVFDAPLLGLSKREVAALARDLDVPLGLTYSCESTSAGPCGACASCLDRKALDVA